MTDYNYATFDKFGRCLTITSAAIPLDMPYEVPKGTKPEDIYLHRDEILPRQQVVITVDRNYFLADGKDTPALSGIPSDAVLVINNGATRKLTAVSPCSMVIETAAKYKCEPVNIAFLELSQLRDKYIAEVEQLAAKAREQFVTLLPGQDTIYAAKEAEAIAWLKREQGKYPYLTAEASSAEVNDMDRLARTIIERADTSRAGLAKIESLRVKAKQVITAAIDVPTMVAAVQEIQ